MPESQGTLRLYGLHLDDRAETTRLAQVEQLLPLFAMPHSGATIALGDFNAMSAHSLGAKLLRTSIAGWLGLHLPSQQLRSMAERVNQMATGTTIARLLEYTSLHDLDTGYSYTISAKQYGMEWAPAIRLGKIDWIFGSKHVQTASYTVLPDSGSDHRPVAANVTINA